MSKKVTKKEMFNFIAEALADNAEVVEFCNKEIALLDKKAEKAKERAAKKKAEGDELKDVIQSVLTAEPQVAADVVETLVGMGVETTVGKVIYRLNALVKEGVAEKEDVVIETPDGKKAKRKAFHLV